MAKTLIRCPARQHIEPLTLQHLVDLRLGKFLVQIELRMHKFQQKPIQYLVEFLYLCIARIISIQDRSQGFIRLQLSANALDIHFTPPLPHPGDLVLDIFLGRDEHITGPAGRVDTERMIPLPFNSSLCSANIKMTIRRITSRGV